MVHMESEILYFAKNTSETVFLHGQIHEGVHTKSALLWALFVFGCEIITTIIATVIMPVKLDNLNFRRGGISSIVFLVMPFSFRLLLLHFLQVSNVASTPDMVYGVGRVTPLWPLGAPLFRTPILLRFLLFDLLSRGRCVRILIQCKSRIQILINQQQFGILFFQIIILS